MEYKTIQLETKDQVAILTLNRPPLNAVNLQMLEELNNALDVVASQKDSRVLIITGAGEKCFSAGLDIADVGNALKIAPLAVKINNRIEAFSKPVIAAINGNALGGGCELALSCFFRIMVNNPKTSIGLTESHLGIMPGWGGTQRLPRTIGKQKALQMMIFGEKISAEEALMIGLVDQTSSEYNILNDALEMGLKLAARPPIAVNGIMEAVRIGLDEGMDAGLAIEKQGVEAVSVSKDAIEGFTAFLEKRKPIFSGE